MNIRKLKAIFRHPIVHALVVIWVTAIAVILLNKFWWHIAYNFNLTISR